MKKIADVSLVATLVFSLVFAGGCATMDSTGSTGDDALRTKTEGATAGLVLGGVLGGILGRIIGGPRGTAIGAGIGAALGGTAGYAYGTSVANKKAEYATTEEWLTACLKELQDTNKEAVAYNEQLKITLASYASGSGTNAKKHRQAIQEDTKKSQGVLSELKETRDRHKEVASSTTEGTKTRKKMRAEIDKMDKHIQLLEQYNQQLLAMSNVS